jgi:hypothetical protein
VPGGLVGGEQGFRVAAFAGAGAAEDEGGGNGWGSLRGFGWRSARGARQEDLLVTIYERFGYAKVLPGWARHFLWVGAVASGVAMDCRARRQFALVA